jgi:hypothetical protein
MQSCGRLRIRPEAIGGNPLTFFQLTLLEFTWRSFPRQRAVNLDVDQSIASAFLERAAGRLN